MVSPFFFLVAPLPRRGFNNLLCFYFYKALLLVALHRQHICVWLAERKIGRYNIIIIVLKGISHTIFLS